MTSTLLISLFLNTHVYARTHTYTHTHIHTYTHTHILTSYSISPSPSLTTVAQLPGRGDLTFRLPPSTPPPPSPHLARLVQQWSAPRATAATCCSPSPRAFSRRAPRGTQTTLPRCDRPTLLMAPLVLLARPPDRRVSRACAAAAVLRASSASVSRFWQGRSALVCRLLSREKK